MSDEQQPADIDGPRWEDEAADILHPPIPTGARDGER